MYVTAIFAGFVEGPEVTYAILGFAGFVSGNSPTKARYPA